MLPLVRIENEKIVHIPDYRDILFIQIRKNINFFRTFEGEHCCLRTAKEFYEALNPYGFEFVDRYTLAQINRITDYKKGRGIALFEEENKTTQFCYVSGECAKKLQL